MKWVQPPANIATLDTGKAGSSSIGAVVAWANSVCTSFPYANVPAASSGVVVEVQGRCDNCTEPFTVRITSANALPTSGGSRDGAGYHQSSEKDDKSNPGKRVTDDSINHQLRYVGDRILAVSLP